MTTRYVYNRETGKVTLDQSQLTPELIKTVKESKKMTVVLAEELGVDTEVIIRVRNKS